LVGITSVRIGFGIHHVTYVLFASLVDMSYGLEMPQEDVCLGLKPHHFKNWYPLVAKGETR